jgi:hypothetical protein
MSKQPSGHLFKIGDQVRIPGENFSGTVSELGRHEVTVRILVDGEVEHRRYAHEALELEPTMKEATNFIDH